MIDLHVHVLWGLDDGPETIEESIRMCRISYRDGVRTMVATPHTLNGIYNNDQSTILSRVHELNEAIKKCGLRSADCGGRDSSTHPFLTSNSEKGINSACRIPHFEFRILPGADVHFCEGVLHQLDCGKAATVGNNGKCLFLEFPSQGIPYRAEEVLFQVIVKGMIPVISHPERNLEIAQKPQRYYEMVRMGCLGQVTGMSLTGEFGPKVRQIAAKLLSKRLIHFIASDAHSVHGRSPILSEAVRAAEKIVGKEEARKMVTEFPEAILQGKRPEVPEAIPFY